MLRSPARALAALFEEARRRARRRRLGYAALATIAALCVGAWVLAGQLGGRPHRPASERPASAHLELARRPYLGVSCREANDISCDRVGVAVWLKHPTKRLSVSVAGQPVKMELPCDNWGTSCRTYCRGVKYDQRCGTTFLGFLHNAGLVEGPLKVNPEHGTRWIGKNPAPLVWVRIRSASGASAKERVPLGTGWG